VLFRRYLFVYAYQCRRHYPKGEEMWVEADNTSFIDVAFYNSCSLTIFVQNWKDLHPSQTLCRQFLLCMCAVHCSVLGLYFVSSCCSLRLKPIAGSSKLLKYKSSSDFCRAMLCKRGLCRHAVSVRPSVCPFVTFVNSVKTSNRIVNFFTIG